MVAFNTNFAGIYKQRVNGSSYHTTFHFIRIELHFVYIYGEQTWRQDFRIRINNKKSLIYSVVDLRLL